jgi:protein TonB
MDMPALESRTLQLPQAEADYRPPQLISQVEPVYSAFARQSRMQGTVRVNAKVGIDGVPRSPVCVAGNSVLCQMAFEAISKWRYEPATSDGRPVEAQVLISFSFQLR